MASIYPNRKEGKIVSFKFKAYLGRDEDGKQIFKCKTWIPEKSMSDNKLIALAEKEAMIWESLFIKELSENKRQITPTAITLGTFIEEVWIPYQKSLLGSRPSTTLNFYACSDMNGMRKAVEGVFGR